mmetsp:Transcript_39835/g.104293  ORF Transcript_39835/g.104293 Transcript_39835/m.104293 type:complete len:173 (-) Transcript_39835:438-956(-)
MKVLAYDPVPKPEFEDVVSYVRFDELLAQSDVISLHCKLTNSTRFMISAGALGKMKPGVILINVARGGLIHVPSLMKFIQNGHIGAAGLDVYEEEPDFPLYTHDLSALQDDERMLHWDEQYAKLRALPNVLCTPNSGFLTHEACEDIAARTVQSIREMEAGKPLSNLVAPGW